MTDLAKVLEAYVDCALWSSHVDEAYAAANDMAPDVSLESAGFDRADITREALEAMEDDCASFLACAIDGTDAETLDETHIGHDLWLTRNGHGAGFWDRGLGALGDRLTSLAKPYGESNLCIGDDGKVHVS